jgi:hypothetical protein
VVAGTVIGPLTQHPSHRPPSIARRAPLPKVYRVAFGADLTLDRGRVNGSEWLLLTPADLPASLRRKAKRPRVDRIAAALFEPWRVRQEVTAGSVVYRLQRAYPRAKSIYRTRGR